MVPGALDRLRFAYELTTILHTEATVAAERVGLHPLRGFMTSPAGAAVVNAIGPIRQLVRGEANNPRRYLVILPGTPDNHGAPVQVQSE
jgi:hypothetical protein